MQNCVGTKKTQRFSENILKISKIFACTITSAEIILGSIRECNGLALVLLLGLCYLTFSLPEDQEANMYHGSKMVALLFTISVVLEKKWLTSNFTNIIYLSILCSGVYMMVRRLVTAIYIFIHRIENSPKISKEFYTDARHIFIISFLLIWLVYAVLYLNQYPGALTPDTRDQIQQIFGKKTYNNENPLITTLFVGLWVKIGVLLWGSVNDGVGLYTFVQLTMTALVFAYTVHAIYKYTGSMIKAGIAHIFFNFMPFNIVFSSSMWKDTFFAVCFLLTMTYIWDFMLSSKCERKNYIILFVLVLVTSLTRNSAWSSLLVFGVVMLVNLTKKPLNEVCKKMKKIAATVIAGAISSLIMVSVIYPAFGVVDNGSIVVGLSTPIQQVARVVAEGKELSTKDYCLIEDVVNFDMEEFPDRYEEDISDPIKFAVKVDVLESNLWEYIKMWVRLGLQHPKIYLDAYVGLMKGFWSFEYRSWLWDTRIWENEFGIAKKPKLLPERDLMYCLDRLSNIPNMYILQSSAIVLWITIFTFGYAKSQNNKVAEVLLLPVLMIYIGLMVTAPVSNFRYIYAAAICCPLSFMVFYSKNNFLE